MNATTSSQTHNGGSLHPIVGRLELMAFADECNRTAGFAAIPETTRRGRMKWLRQYERQGGLCALCGTWRAPAEMTRDHTIPRAKNGRTDWDNIQLACAPCNERKGDSLRHPNEKLTQDARP